VVVSAPLEARHVIVVSGGSLTVTGVPEPGFRLAGHLWVVGTGRVSIRNSVVRIMSTYHGQYAVAAIEDGRISVSGCDYRVPSGVQHAIVAMGSARVELEDTDFGFQQLLAAGDATLTAERLDGEFEVIVQDRASMALVDIPRRAGHGELWVWPEFPAGSSAVYTPPLPGPIAQWSFPPPGATGIEQRIAMVNCRARLWPMLVRAGADLTLRDIPPENWVVVGLHMPNSGTVSRLRNGETVESGTVALPDRTVRLERTTVDTWNLYPQGTAAVEVEDCFIGELLGMESSRVSMRRTIVDGTGGYFGSNADATIEADACVFTCTVQAVERSTMILRRSTILPYTVDPTGAWTVLGVHDQARMLLDASAVATQVALGGQGLLAVTGFVGLPDRPPGLGPPVELRGWAAQYSLDPKVGSGLWRVEAVGSNGTRTVVGLGSGNVEGGALGAWQGGDPFSDYELKIVLTDATGRTLEGRAPVLGADRRIRPRLGR
jgi:hypothetical protein